MKYAYFILAALPFAMACQSNVKETAIHTDTLSNNINQDLVLPEPDTTASNTRFSKVIGWPKGKTPVAPPEFTVTKFAERIRSPRNIYVAPNGDVLVALSNSERSTTEKVVAVIIGKAKSEQGGKSANTILLFRDSDGDGKPELQSEFLTDLNQPYGLLIIGDSFYVANTDGIMKYPYKSGDTKITAKSLTCLLGDIITTGHVI